MADDVPDQVRALRAGRAVADLSGWLRLRITGADAATFLGDLVTGPVAGLGLGAATPSFLLTPTGRIRAAFTVARTGAGLLLVQDPGQPEPAGRLLAPYVLSSDVIIEDASGEGPLAALIGPEPPAEADRYTPGALGAGTDALGVDAAGAAGTAGAALAGPEALEIWRVLEGRPRLGADLTAESLPHEVPGYEASIDFTKGCFLGQEAVARVRNLGRPPFVLIHLRGEASVEAGEELLAGGEAAGRITSAAADPDGGWAALARVAWDARERDLETASGVPLVRA